MYYHLFGPLYSLVIGKLASSPMDGSSSEYITPLVLYSGRPANETCQPSGTPLKTQSNLLEIHEIGSGDTSESKQNYDQI